MTKTGIPIALTGLAMLGGCANVDTCDELAFYETAHSGRRIEAPADLDNPDPAKELVVPEASPRPPRDLTAGCLDRPPTLKITRDGDDD